MSSTTTMRPSRFATMLSYFLSYFTRPEATRALPERRAASKWVPFTVSSGKKVARPAFSSRKKAMAALAAVSPSTTMFCSAKPSAVSMAISYPGSTVRMLLTGPMMPRSRRFCAARITVFTLCWYPSMLRSRSPSTCRRCWAASSCRLACCSAASASSSCFLRLASFISRPFLMFSSRVTFSSTPVR